MKIHKSSLFIRSGSLALHSILRLEDDDQETTIHSAELQLAIISMVATDPSNPPLRKFQASGILS